MGEIESEAVAEVVGDRDFAGDDDDDWLLETDAGAEYLAWPEALDDSTYNEDVGLTGNDASGVCDAVLELLPLPVGRILGVDVLDGVFDPLLADDDERVGDIDCVWR